MAAGHGVASIEVVSAIYEVQVHLSDWCRMAWLVDAMPEASIHKSLDGEGKRRSGVGGVGSWHWGGRRLEGTQKLMVRFLCQSQFHSSCCVPFVTSHSCSFPFSFSFLDISRHDRLVYKGSHHSIIMLKH